LLIYGFSPNLSVALLTLEGEAPREKMLSGGQ